MLMDKRKYTKITVISHFKIQSVLEITRCTNVNTNVNPYTADQFFKSVLLEDQITLLVTKCVFTHQELQMFGLK